MKKRNKKKGWTAAVAVLLLFLGAGAYYSVSRATDEMTYRISGEVTPDALYAQAMVPTETPLLYQRLPNEGVQPGKPLPGETPAITFEPATIASK